MEKLDRKIKSSFLESPWKVFLWEAGLFGLTLGLGLATGLKAQRVFTKEQVSLESFSFLKFLIHFAIANIVLWAVLFFSRKTRKVNLVKILFLFSIGFSLLIFINTWLPSIWSLILTLGIIMLWVKKSQVLIHDLVMVFAIAGAGSILGLRLEPKMVIGLLVLFSIYDFIAVYKTGHMIKMAKSMIKKGAIPGLIVPPQTGKFKRKLKQVQPGGKFMILGGGDIVFPLLFCVSLLSQGIYYALTVALFSMLGLLSTFLIFAFQKQRKPIPALPPIALFSIMGYLVTTGF